MEYIRKCQVCSEVNPGFGIQRKGFDIGETGVREIQPQVKEDDNLEEDFKNAEDASLKRHSLLLDTKVKPLLSSASRSIGEGLLRLNKEEDRENFIWYRQGLIHANENLVDIESLCFKNQPEEIISQNKETEEENKKINKEEKNETDRKSSFEHKKDSFLQRTIQKKVFKREGNTHKAGKNIGIDAKEAIYLKIVKRGGRFSGELLTFKLETFPSDQLIQELSSIPLYSLLTIVKIYQTKKSEKQVNSFLKNLKSGKVKTLLLSNNHLNRRITPLLQDLFQVNSNVVMKLQLHQFNLTRMQFVKTLKVFRHLPEILFESCKFILQDPIYLSNAFERCKISKLGFEGCESDSNCGWSSNSEELDTLIETLSSSEHLKKSCNQIKFEEKFKRKDYAIEELKLNGFRWL